MRAMIAVLAGDGIGPEVTVEAERVLTEVGERFGHGFEFVRRPIGGESIDAHGVPLTEETEAVCRRADAVFLGAIGGPKWDGVEPANRPEQGLLRLRKSLGVFTNLRPVRVHPALAGRGPLKPEIAAGVDMVIVRELTGGIYFGRRTRDERGATDECRYSVAEIERVARAAFEIARGRTRRVASLDKANVLETSRLWRSVTQRVRDEEYADVELTHQLIDSAAMKIITSPGSFDVLLTENMFGDIISDEASVLTGSLGMLGSASLGARRPGLFEPVHGSAPDIAGRGVANPYGAIAAAEMLLRDGLGLSREADAVKDAADRAIDAGVLTVDCGGSATTAEVGEAVVNAIATCASCPA